MLDAKRRLMPLFTIGLAVLAMLFVAGSVSIWKQVINPLFRSEIYYRPFSNQFNKTGKETLLSNAFYDSFLVESINITKKEHNKLLFTFSADEIIHRKRRAKLFVYQNLKELYLSKVRIEIYPPDPDKNMMLFDNISTSIASIGKPGTSAAEYLTGSSDPELDLLTSLLFKDIAINIRLPQDKSVFFSASQAKINADFANIVLHGEVKVKASDKAVLQSTLAIWSKEHNGIYLPDGYVFKSAYYKKKAFMRISQKGELLRQTKIPSIEYTDPIEEKEKILYTKISKNLPLHIRLMLGLP